MIKSVWAVLSEYPELSIVNDDLEICGEGTPCEYNGVFLTEPAARAHKAYLDKLNAEAERENGCDPVIVTVAEWPLRDADSVSCSPQAEGESLDLRNMVLDELEYKGLDKSLADSALCYVKNSDRLMQLLDMVVDEAIAHCQKEEE